MAIISGLLALSSITLFMNIENSYWRIWLTLFAAYLSLGAFLAARHVSNDRFDTLMKGLVITFSWIFHVFRKSAKPKKVLLVINEVVVGELSFDEYESIRRAIVLNWSVWFKQLSVLISTIGMAAIGSSVTIAVLAVVCVLGHSIWHQVELIHSLNWLQVPSHYEAGVIFAVFTALYTRLYFHNHIDDRIRAELRIRLGEPCNTNCFIKFIY